MFRIFLEKKAGLLTHGFSSPRCPFPQRNDPTPPPPNAELGRALPPPLYAMEANDTQRWTPDCHSHDGRFNFLYFSPCPSFRLEYISFACFVLFRWQIVIHWLRVRVGCTLQQLLIKIGKWHVVGVAIHEFCGGVFPLFLNFVVLPKILVFLIRWICAH